MVRCVYRVKFFNAGNSKTGLRNMFSCTECKSLNKTGYMISILDTDWSKGIDPKPYCKKCAMELTKQQENLVESVE